MRFWFVVDTSQKVRPDDFGRVLSVHSLENDAQAECIKLKNLPVYLFLRVVEADYRQLDSNHFLMAEAKTEPRTSELPEHEVPQLEALQPSKPEGCFLVANNQKNGKIHVVVDHLVYLGSGIRPTNSLLCTGNGYEENRYPRREDIQEVTCPRCLSLLHYLNP